MASKKDNTIENRGTQSPTLCQSSKNKSRSACGIFQPLKQHVPIQTILLSMTSMRGFLPFLVLSALLFTGLFASHTNAEPNPLFPVFQSRTFWILVCIFVAIQVIFKLPVIPLDQLLGLIQPVFF